MAGCRGSAPAGVWGEAPIIKSGEKMAKKRLDVLLFEKGLVESRERAKTMIMEGNVLVDEKKIDKCGAQVKEDAKIRLLKEDFPFVSRGGLKLQKGIDCFKIELKDAVAVDIGASTGGFTDCMLKSGAKKVYAVDVGYGQLAWKLRTDDRVVNLERTNIRNVTEKEVPEKLDFASIDVAFISLEKVLPTVKNLLKERGKITALIKPQFEAGRERVGKKGVVRDKEVHVDVIKNIVDFCEREKLSILDLTYSPIKGPEGNIEYLIYLVKQEELENKINNEYIITTVEKAHNKLN